MEEGIVMDVKIQTDNNNILPNVNCFIQATSDDGTLQRGHTHGMRHKYARRRHQRT